MEVDPFAVGAAARAWDEQHLDLQAAGRQVAAADAAPFGAPVAAAAARFASTWSRFVVALGDRCEEQADGLRTALDEALAADQESGITLDVVRAATRELR